MLTFFLCFLTLLFQPSHCTTILVDGVSEWKNPSARVGDSIFFEHKYHYNLYIFQNREAYDRCNFTQATLLNKPNTTFTWYPSRPGLFYFSFNNGTVMPCREGQKLAIRVSPTQAQDESPTPELPPAAAAPPASGGMISSSPTYQWPFHPRHRKAAPGPTALGKSGGSGIPFINSNPAVPLPTGEVDTATIRPLPTSGNGGQAMGWLAIQMPVSCVVFMML
ncbi:early nodulin-like protein 6 [Malania oleifera]|uniref:early nodulin-like protein 6 n=1 Tax=Malania oleifera TaxID=397392 RepID=UPI0025ADCDCF|nr:early nodulin-like protein 6 [Malania oleifera]